MGLAKLKHQFQNYINSLKKGEIQEYEIKLINIILENFDSIASCGTAGGKRGRLLYDLIIKNGKNVSSQFKLTENAEKPVDIATIERLISLEVENFRGFTIRCNFNLDKQFLLVYGINGSGKSSFCEALEYFAMIKNLG